MRMDRRKELWEYSQDFLEEKTGEHGDAIRKGFEDGGAYKQALLSAMTELFLLVKHQQLKQGKDELHYIGFHFLRSSLVIHKAEILIAAYSDEYYLDGVEATAFWPLDDLLPYIDAGIAELTPLINKKFIRVKDYEITEIKHAYLLNHLLLMMPFAVELLPSVFRTAEFADVCVAPELQVLCGELMEKNVCLYTHRKSEEL
jgi:hypothetical protein